MADILIRGMEMPENCGECVFLRKLEKATPYTSRFWCCIKGNAVLKHEKSKYCPLAPLPEGHGRMGDLDALDKFLAEREKEAEAEEFYLGESWYNTFRQILKKRPTIVPAEGGTDNG